MIVVNFANFPKFIDAIGGVDVTTGRVCSDISGGTANGGFTLNLQPGHPPPRTAIQALDLARTRENQCNPAETDLTREQHQQQILNAIKSQLLSPGTFFRLPWASWDAPQGAADRHGRPRRCWRCSRRSSSAATRAPRLHRAERAPDGDVLTITQAATGRRRAVPDVRQRRRSRLQAGSERLTGRSC